MSAPDYMDMEAKLYLIKQIRRSISVLQHCKSKRQFSRTRNTQDVFSFGLHKFVNTTCEHHGSNKHPCTLMYKLCASLKIADFLDLYKPLDLIAGCLTRLHQYGQFLPCRLVEDLKLICASVQLRTCFWKYVFDVLHKSHYVLYLHTISIGSAIRNRRHLQGQTYLASREFVSCI